MLQRDHRGARPTMPPACDEMHGAATSAVWRRLRRRPHPLKTAYSDPRHCPPKLIRNRTSATLSAAWSDEAYSPCCSRHRSRFGSTRTCSNGSSPKGPATRRVSTSLCTLFATRRFDCLARAVRLRAADQGMTVTRRVSMILPDDRWPAVIAIGQRCVDVATEVGADAAAADVLGVGGRPGHGCAQARRAAGIDSLRRFVIAL